MSSEDEALVKEMEIVNQEHEDDGEDDDVVEEPVGPEG